MSLFIGFMISLFLLIGLITGLTPFMGRKSSQFGVSLPENYQEDPQLKKWMKQYCFITVLSSVLFSLPFLWFTRNKDAVQTEMQLGIYSVVGIAAVLAVSGLAYLVIHKKVSTWKKNLPKTADQDSGQEIVVELNYRKKGTTISNILIIISNLIIISGTAFATWLNYQQIPETFPIHWGIDFKPDRFATKSVKTVFGLLAVQLIMIIIFVISNYSIKNAKQSLNPKNASVSSLKNRLFRQAWSRFTLVISILTQLLMSALQLATVFVNDVEIQWFIYLTIGYTILVIVYAIVLSMKYGQDGERLKMADSLEEKDTLEYRYNEDQYWKLGVFYYNPADPSIWVEKRFGVGTTTNFARWQSWAIIVGILILAFSPLLFL
ncbi:DUF1648 domain-containing protein [Carnobacterium sp. CS13]|uniref:DUF1648 domain-containing protein n=1 Tax=Carnobacterium sp. CS13 TaxID=2800128 RepID=UPI001913336B|nr:DUF5808 domain-containing protein [Carnobacterium sp. CS13]QQP71255.1 DUF1648 domain-containing protein [Carnobacterium sp. CS13]